ncbi:TPA: ATP-binding protein [Streptococcus suis]|nr:ATP-binding protein [Streptococcus suis]HEM5005824.1 ATP-binding protein [Streptococcus suis]
MTIELAYPICATHENMGLRKDGTVRAFYRIPNTPITVTDSRKKEQHKEKVTRILNKLNNQKYFEISLIPKDYLLEEKMRDFSKALSEDSREIGKRYLSKVVSDLTAEMEIPYQYDWVVGIDIRSALAFRSFKELVQDKSDKIVSGLLALAGYTVEQKENWYEDYIDDEQKVFQILNALKAKRLANEELYYYQAMEFIPYIPHLKEEVIANRELINISDTVITVEDGGYLKFESPYGISYIDMLPIGRFPTIINGMHIGEYLQRFQFPVHLKILGEYVESSGIRGTMARSNVRYFNIMKEAHSTNTVQQEEIILGNKSLKDLMRKVGKREQLIECCVTLMVCGSSVAQLRKRRTALLSYFQDLRVGLFESKFDTMYLFQSHLMGQCLTKNAKFWNHLVIAKGLSELMLFTNTFSGNRIGWYIGRVDNNLKQWDNLQRAVYSSKNLVLFNPTVGNKEDIEGKQTKNPHFAITGATGEGKSYLAEMIFLLTSFLDVRQLYIDPKRSIRKHWEAKINNPEFQKKYPDMVKHIQGFKFVTLDAKEPSNKGVLDPIVMLSPVDAISTAKNMIFYLLAGERLELTQKTAIGEVVSTVVEQRSNGEMVGFRTVIELLIENKSKEISDLGYYLQSIIDSSILELAFSYGDVSGLSYDDRNIILEVADLSLPSSGKDSVTISDHEQKSVALMFALGAFCRRFGENNRKEDTIEYFDEAWVLLRSNEGKEIVENMKRIGRYYSNILGLITQSVEDTRTEEDGTGFGTLFAFKETKEYVLILEHMGLETTEENVEWVKHMISGQCLYKDVYGNVNMISVHTPHKAIDELLKPMEATVSSNLESKYAN